MNEAFEKRESFMQKLGGGVMEIVGPALVMLIVGSLAFFLIEVFYDGPYMGRMKYIFGLFTFAAVLISRISIELGSERASLYGFVLALATLMVANRFVGGGSSFLGLGGLMGNFMLLMFIWWCAARLTWDCTFIDNTRDATGQGMIDLAIERFNRFRDGKPADLEASPISYVNEEQADVAMVDSQDSQQPTPGRNALLDFLFKRRRANTPGLWVFYFLIAGLPIFGLGQLFLGMNNVAGHRAAAFHFATYMIGTLCLLMLTSMLGLHRYLGRHRATMPSRVAKRWMIMGTILAIAIVGITFWLPRPIPEYSIANWLPKLISRDLDPSRFSFGRDGQKKDKNNSNLNVGPQSRDKGQSSESDADGSSGSAKKDAAGKSGGSSKKQDDQSQTKQEGNRGGGGHDEGKQDSKGSSSKSGGQKSGKSSGPKKSDAEHKSNQGSQSENKSSQSKHQDNKSQSDKPDSDQEQQSDSGSKKSDGQKSDSQKSGSQKSEKPSGPQHPDEKRGPQQKDQSKQAGSKSNQSSRSQRQPRNQDNDKNRSGQDQSAQPQQPSQTPSQLLNAIGAIFRLIFFLIILAIIIFMAIKYRDRLLPALRSFLEELLEFWRRLFDRKPKTQSEQVEGLAAKREKRMPAFSQFRNPFATGKAASWTAEQLIRYTFQAMEAWAREHDCPRDPEQTPHEFVEHATRKVRSMAEHGDYLADLYCQMAYSKRRVSKKSALQLTILWEKMSQAQAPVPTRVV